MFISFIQLDAPNSIDEHEARFLRERLLAGSPSGESVQAAEKIKWAAEGDGSLWGLSRAEMEAIVTALADASAAGAEVSERLRWIEQQLGALLDDPTAF
jgi:hypothetical protein